MIPQEEITYLGFDFSTQQLKGIVIDDKFKVVHEANVHFDTDLQEFRTHNGIIKGEDKKTVTSPVLMWVKALDMLLDRLRICGADFSKVAALSGSAQQHGTVYWSVGAEEVLKKLDNSHFLHTQLASCFSVTNSPIWMDSSTTKECESLEKSLGGAEALAKITGSKAYERYSAAQIAKIYSSKPVAYKNTERISLVSSFACSLFLGKYAPIDWSDGSGMNLFDIEKKTWSEQCLNACAMGLDQKLGMPVPSQTVLGKISDYYVERFGFNEDCNVVAFTGDNPSSLAGICLKEQDIAVSLGTSDTVFLWLSEPKTLPEGHILINPVDQERYMVLLCFKNGSLTRERIRNLYSDRSWDQFNKLLESTPKGNYGYLGLYYDSQEIIPSICGDFRFDKDGKLVNKFPSPEIEVRALIEGQFLAKKAHLLNLGINIGPESRMLATGGGSKNHHILQVLADVFMTPVYTFDSGNSAVIGGAYRAYHASLLQSGGGEGTSFSTFTSSVPFPAIVCQPSINANEVYAPMLERYREIIKNLTECG